MKYINKTLINLTSVLTIKLIILSLLITPISSNAEIALSSYAFEEKFDTDNYIPQIVRLSGGATHTWLPTGGWRGGAAKFTPPLSDQGYAGVGGLYMDSIPTENQVNVRFLIYHGSTWQEYGSNNKVFILDGVNAREQRSMVISRETGEYVAWGACSGTVCKYEAGGLFPDGSETFRIGNKPLHREEEWISVEIESNVASQYVRLYIHTQDGEFNGLYIEQTLDISSNPAWMRLDMIGGFMDAAIQADPNNYFIIDEVKLSTSYIGPPAGFLADPPPKAPILED
jgi:hypothetical protein